jgi:endo-1,4-beta-xylanase
MIKQFVGKISGLVGGLVLLTACQSSAPEPTTLKDAFKDDFYIGTALNTRQYTGQDDRALPIIQTQFNAITAENDMKWERIHPQPDEYNFELADQFIAFGEANDQYILGHTLVWHSQTPRWVFQDEDGELLSREALLARMEDHIKTVVGRYKGRVDGWDVVNEALNDDGTMRESLWYKIIGDDFIEMAFKYAHEADPEAELYYNDYNLHLADKADGAVRIVKAVQENGGTVTGIGMQGHYGLTSPTREEFENSILKFKELGEVAITELDIDVLPSPWDNQGAEISRRAENSAAMNPYTEGLPDSVVQLQTEQLKMLFEVMLKHKDAVNRVTTWGVTDGDSWKNGWPIPGRTNYPLLFDRSGAPKSVVDELIDLSIAE